MESPVLSGSRVLTVLTGSLAVEELIGPLLFCVSDDPHVPVK